MDAGLLSSLPTDSLYKFMALSGLTLLVVCFVFPSYFRKSLSESRFQLRRSLAAEEVQLEHMAKTVNDRLKLLDKADADLDDAQSKGEKLEKTIKELDRKLEQLDKDSESAESKIMQELSELNVQLDAAAKDRADHAAWIEKIQQQSAEMESKILEKAIMTAESQCDAERVESLASQLRKITIVQISGIILGLALSVSGFSMWYFKLQVYIDQYTHSTSQPAPFDQTSVITQPSPKAEGGHGEN